MRCFKNWESWAPLSPHLFRLLYLQVMSDRYMAEAQKRENLLHNEQESRLREEQRKQELMQQVRSLTPSFP